MSALRDAAAVVYGLGWELRRRLYARGALQPSRVPARVVSIGNLTVGGTGKTTLALHLGRWLRDRGADVAVVCRRYRPGPRGTGDEEQMFVDAFGPERVHAGTSKRELARRAAAAGHAVILVDDGFSHWALERDVNLVTIDAQDPWGGGSLLPAGRLREPRRALERADAVILTRLEPDLDPEPLLAAIARAAPAARLAAGRHRVTGARALDGTPARPATRVWIVTATGNPLAVERSARAAGFEVAGLSRHRDHHWFRAAEVAAERERARAANATLLLTAKDAVRWPPSAAAGVQVLEVEWQWVQGGETIERMVEGNP